MLKRVNGEFLFFVLNLFLLVLPVASAEEGLAGNNGYRAVVLPGMNGRGGESHRKLGIDNTDNTQRYETLSGRKIDFGQEHCIDHFERQLARDLARDPSVTKGTIFYGTSQGTATLLNCFGRKPFVEQEHLAKALVLESVLGSGNSAIRQTTSSFSPLGRLAAALPFSRAWLPLCAKAAYPSYSPWGLQAISSAAKISPNIPVIIMHNRGDEILNIRDARAVYCSLLRSGHKKTYLIEANNGNRHLNILDYSKRRIDERDKIIAGLQNIYLHEGLPVSAAFFSGSQDIAKYQPSLRSTQLRVTLSPPSIMHKIVDSGALVTAAYFAGRALI